MRFTLRPVETRLFSPPPSKRRRRQLHQGRQKAGQRLAGAGRRDQQRRAVVAGLCQQRQLMLARRPAARGEPAPEAVGQQRSRFKRREGQGIGRRHGEEVSRRGGFVEGLAVTSPRLRGRGRIASQMRIRVRGYRSSARTACAERAPHPALSPRRTGRGRGAAVRAPTPSPACRKCPSPCR